MLHVWRVREHRKNKSIQTQEKPTAGEKDSIDYHRPATQRYIARGDILNCLLILPLPIPKENARAIWKTNDPFKYILH
jgi:hypothetical protein